MLRLMSKYKWLPLAFAFVCTIQVEVYSQVQEERIEIYFKQDKYNIDANYLNNEESLARLRNLLESMSVDTLTNLSKIKIHSWTSPEPGVAYNKVLSWNRSNSIKDYILKRWNVPDSMLVAYGEGIAWDKLRKLVVESDMQYKDEVLNILDNQPEETWKKAKPTDRWLTLVDSRIKRLMDLRGGRPYKYLYEVLYPQLRYGSQILFYFNEPIGSYVPAIMPLPDPIVNYTPYESTYKKPVIALKTNLLYDAATALNVELEVPIKYKYSLAGEWIFPWWVAKDNGAALEVLSGNLELRYWLGSRRKAPVMTGVFYGLYAGGGLYDFQWNDNGYQGEFYIAAGFSLGYAHALNKSKNFRMEYSVGLGYLKTNYRYYEGKLDNKYLVWQHDGEFSWIGPTKVKMSLVWMLFKTKGGGQ